MVDFKAKMHQILLSLELRPRPNWRAYRDSVFKGPTSKERRRDGKGRKEKGREREVEFPLSSHSPKRSDARPYDTF